MPRTISPVPRAIGLTRSYREAPHRRQSFEPMNIVTIWLEIWAGRMACTSSVVTDELNSRKYEAMYGAMLPVM